MTNFIKTFVYFILLATILTSCSSIKVVTDYDKKATFNNYKTYAFYKKGIKSVALSDIDKKRILTAIETQLKNKGLTRSSEHPDLLVNIATNAERHFDYNVTVTGNPVKYTKGEITIELIDYADKKLVWQGTASGILNYLNTKDVVGNKEIQIKEFVSEIMTKYPPVVE